MEDILGEIGKGFLRGLGYILADVFFHTLCYWVGWPICKIFTWGNYPKPKREVYFDHDFDSGYWCSFVGLIFIIGMGIYAILNFG